MEDRAGEIGPPVHRQIRGKPARAKLDGEEISCRRFTAKDLTAPGKEHSHSYRTSFAACLPAEDKTTVIRNDFSRVAWAIDNGGERAGPTTFPGQRDLTMSQASRDTNRRRSYVVDRKWQIPVVIGIGGAIFAAGSVMLLTNYLLSAPDTVDNLTGQETAQLLLALEVAYVLIGTATMVAVTLRITHTVSGPAMLLERAIEAIRVGRFDSRLSLRKGDYLKPVAAALQNLSDELEKQRTDFSRTCAELELALGQGKVPEAQALLPELRRAAGPRAVDGVERVQLETDVRDTESALPTRSGESRTSLPHAVTAQEAHHAPETKDSARARRAGFSLVETLLGLVVLVIVIGSAVLTGVRCAQMQRTTEAMIEAHNASRDVIEQCRTGGLLTHLTHFTDQPTFASADLQVRVQFPAAVLSQTLGGAIPATSRFRDNNGDGQVELNAGATDTFGLLPVRVTASRAGFNYQIDTLVVGP